MLKKILFTVLFIGLLSAQAQIKTAAPSPFSKVTQMVGLTEISIEYSRPAMRGRIIYGDLVPFDKIWRTGANARTKITFNDDVVIKGDSLKKGTYAIFTKPNVEMWDIYFYTEYKGGGAPQKLDDSKVALKIAVKPQKLDVTIQSFTMGFDDITDASALVTLLWENTSIAFKINTPTDAISLKSIEKVMAGPSANDFYNAASYYRKKGLGLKQALTWITKATELNKNAFWMTREKSLIHAALGDKKSAIAAAKLSLKVAKEQGNAGFVKMNEKSIAGWSK